MYQGGLSADLCFEPYQMSSESSDILEALSLNVIVLFYFWDLPWGGEGEEIELCVGFFFKLKGKKKLWQLQSALKCIA